MKIDNIMESIELALKRDHQVSLMDATTAQLHDALSGVVMGEIASRWYESRHAHDARSRSPTISARSIWLGARFTTICSCLASSTT